MNKYELTFYVRQNLYKRIVYAKTLKDAEIELYKEFESIHIENTICKNGIMCDKFKTLVFESRLNDERYMYNPVISSK